MWFGDAGTGNFDLAIGAIVSSLLDPSDYFNAWYRTGGPQNYSFWHNAEFDELLDQIDTEVDAGKRMALIRRAEDIMEQDPPLVPVAWENILDVWFNYVKGPQSEGLLRNLRRGPVRYVLAGQGLTEHLCRELDRRHETVDLLVSRVTVGRQAEGVGITDHLLARLSLDPLDATQGGVAGDPHGADR